MFFENFFGVFNNNRTFDDVTFTEVRQTAQIYPGLNTIGNVYIGSETLPTGTNPFAPTPDEKNKNWIWIVVLSVLCVLLLGGLGFAIYKWKTAQQGSAEKREMVYGENVPLANNASEDI